jgi:hypothetical protein
MINEWVCQIKEADQSAYSVSGEGAKNLWIICTQKDLTTENEIQLNAIIQAIRYDPAKDCKLLRISERTSVSDIIHTPISHLLVFGIPPEYIGYNIEVQWYEPLYFEQFTAIFSESLEALSKDKAKKARLWTSLKKVFLES